MTIKEKRWWARALMRRIAGVLMLGLSSVTVSIMLLMLGVMRGIWGDVLRAFAVLSKYLGCYDEFTRLRKACGSSWERRDGFQSFLRIVQRNAKGDMVEWVKSCVGRLDRTFAGFVKFVCLSGLRLGEAVQSFNLVVRLSREGRLNEYYNGGMQCLEHYRFPEKFIRVKKNAFISFVPENVINEVCKCRGVSESGLKRRLTKHKMERRLRDLRDHFATFMVFHGLLREEVDLLQGRVGRFIFMRHYFSPSLKELRDKTLKAVNALIRSNRNLNLFFPSDLPKFTSNVMTDEMLNISESVADFIQGRTLKNIGARHYMKLKRKAIQFYPRYAEYVTQLSRNLRCLWFT